MRKALFISACVATLFAVGTVYGQGSNAAGPPTIAFMTDFGMNDDSVAICKGVMWSIAPTARIVDVAHVRSQHDPSHLEPQAIVHGAAFLFDTTPYYPSGTVFVVIIDPRAASSRKIVVKSKRGQYLVLPDNGLTTLVQDRDGIEGARQITNPSWMIGNALSTSFEGRDIFAPVAAHLVRGEDWKEVGPEVKDLVRLKIGAAQLDDRGVTGEAISIEEPYGNVITNISGDDLRKLGYEAGQRVRLTLGTTELLLTFAKSFGDVASGKPLLFTDSRSGRLCLAIDSATLWDFCGLLPALADLSQEIESTATAYGSTAVHDVSDGRNCMVLGFVKAYR
jgi:S-adenosylmethionine hydrolase